MASLLLFLIIEIILIIIIKDTAGMLAISIDEVRIDAVQRAEVARATTWRVNFTPLISFD